MGITARAGLRRIGPSRPGCRQDYAGPGAGRADLCAAAIAAAGRCRGNPIPAINARRLTRSRLIYSDRADLGHDLPLGRWPRRNRLAAFRGLEIGMLTRKSATLGPWLVPGACVPLRKICDELSVKASWLDQFGRVIVGHGTSLSDGEVEASCIPRHAAMPSPFRR